ncbi:MAG: hypothetical protein NT126_10650 [Bacteroidetes bacterium]|nr:hypothetical protein [Bacteroidota bacterium]
MKKYSRLLAVTFLIVSVSGFGCKKSSKDTVAPTPPPAPVSIICDGNGSGTYYPLVLNNTWHYTDGSINSFSNTVTGQATYGSYTYFKVDNTLGGTVYLRKAANGDIMIYNSSTSSELLFIPASPVNNQSWAFTMNFAATRKVINTSASLTTPSCSYTGCLEIQNLDAGNVVQSTFYFKKGIGMIRTDEIWSGKIVTPLNALTLY